MSAQVDVSLLLNCESSIGLGKCGFALRGKKGREIFLLKREDPDWGTKEKRRNREFRDSLCFGLQKKTKVYLA